MSNSLSTPNEASEVAALRIDPETAEVEWIYADIGDPYGVHNLPAEGCCAGRAYFARSPESDIWVCFDDLPEMVRDALWERLVGQAQRKAGVSGRARGATPTDSQ